MGSDADGLDEATGVNIEEAGDRCCSALLMRGVRSRPNNFRNVNSLD